jgi:bleomycin hydrolase
MFWINNKKLKLFKMRRNKILVLMMLLTVVFASFAQDKKNGYEFTEVKNLDATDVKNQYRSGTCWSYSALSFIESELIRMGKGNFNLSEMYVVRKTYEDKAEKYVRMHGNLNFAGGGSFYDVLYVIKKYGIVPEEEYDGLHYGTKKHVHGEMDAVLKAYVDAVIKDKNKELSSAWLNGLKGILDAYLGELPDNPEDFEFKFDGKKYNPKSFVDKKLGLNPDDYVSITSFTHHDWYTAFAIEVPDNWAWGLSYNVPLDEMMQIMDYAIENGYTIAWGSDVSEKGFSWNHGLAIVPEKSFEDLSDLEQAKWSTLPQDEQKAIMLNLNAPGKEQEIDQDVRQKDFNNYKTTDDHGMHITGIAKDQNGTKYYIVKNSWGESGFYDGYLYASEAFVKYKTLNIVIHKDAIPSGIKANLGL